jgi:hypothetical protein
MLVRAFEHALTANQNFWRMLVATSEGYSIHFQQITKALDLSREAHTEVCISHGAPAAYERSYVAR